jgi:hypothetical protein
MKIKKTNAKIVNPKMPANANGLVVISTGGVNSSPLNDGRIAIINGIISTVSS